MPNDAQKRVCEATNTVSVKTRLPPRSMLLPQCQYWFELGYSRGSLPVED